MAKLCRLSKLNDRFDTQVFTFQLPPSLVKECSPDVLSREFFYGGHSWTTQLIRSEKHVGVFLGLKSPSAGIMVHLDYSFTVLNNDHFTRNDSVVERGVLFDAQNPVQGRKTFIGISDLSTRGFMQDGGDFLIELELRNSKTTFEQIIQLPRDKDYSHHNSAYDRPKIETNYFTYGTFDWSISVSPSGDSSQNEGRPLVSFTRQTHFDHLSRVKYRLVIGRGEKMLETDVIQQIFDLSGQGTPYDVGFNLYQLAPYKNRLPLKAELLSVTPISEVQLCPLNRSKNRAHLYDLEKQAWLIESDISLEYLKLRLYYMDVKNVPRKFLRFVSWSAKIIPARGNMRTVKCVGGPFSNYYAQTDMDEGYDLNTDIPVNELNDPDSNYLDEEYHRLTIQVDWIDSHLLYHERYQKLDDISYRHKHQMWREIMALQAENYALEKQLHTYQVTALAKDEAPKPKSDEESPPEHERHHNQRIK